MIEDTSPNKPNLDLDIGDVYDLFQSSGTPAQAEVWRNIDDKFSQHSKMHLNAVDNKSGETLQLSMLPVPTGREIQDRTDDVSRQKRRVGSKYFIDATHAAVYELSRRVTINKNFLTAFERAQRRQRNAKNKQRKLARKRPPKTFGRNKRK